MGTNTITDTKVGQWDTAYGYGNHASAGYLSGTLGFPTDLGAVTGSTTSYLGLGPDLGSVASGDTFVGMVKDFGGFSETVNLSRTQTLTNKTITDAASISTTGTLNGHTLPGGTGTFALTNSFTHFHSSAQTVTSTESTNNDSGSVGYTFSELSGAIHFVAFLNRTIMRASEYSVSGTTLTVNTGVLATDDQIEVTGISV